MSKPTVLGKRGKRLEDKDSLIRYLKRSTTYVNDCWIFTGGGNTSSGYRKVMIDYKDIMVHRLSAYIFHGFDINDNTQQVNHKPECSDRRCWNPDHIYVGTQKDNMKDERQDYCARGHRLFRKSDTRKVCLVCNRMRSRTYRAKHRATRMKNV